MPKLHVIVIAYEKPIQTRICVDAFLTQTWTNWEMTIIHDGPASEEFRSIVNAYSDPRIFYIETEKRVGAWGHENRRIGLQLINGKRGDFLLITNNDNYNPPRYLEYMFRQVRPDVGMIYCDFLHHNFEYKLVTAQPKLNHIDMACYLVEITIAQKIGFRRSDSSADGLFAEEIAAYCRKNNKRVVHVDLPLLVHN